MTSQFLHTSITLYDHAVGMVWKLLSIQGEFLKQVKLKEEVQPIEQAQGILYHMILVIRKKFLIGEIVYISDEYLLLLSNIIQYITMAQEGNFHSVKDTVTETRSLVRLIQSTIVPHIRIDPGTNPILWGVSHSLLRKVNSKKLAYVLHLTIN